MPIVQEKVYSKTLFFFVVKSTNKLLKLMRTDLSITKVPGTAYIII